MGSELGLTADTENKARKDGVAIFYAVLVAVWTLLILVGGVFLYTRRNDPVLRIRGIVLSLASIFFLHMYWISVQFGYMTGPITPGDAEYWIMGTWLPLGIALFHASNNRFLHVAQAQKRFINDQHKKQPDAPRPKPKGLVARLKQATYTQRMLVLIFAGMVAQILVTIIMWLLSRKWHPSFGIAGTAIKGGHEMERKVMMGVGWEWWPTVFWQIFWAWIVAPIILWRARNIHDTQGWRLQTVACCIANLHAAPMWLIALYVPGMDKMNEYWIPPQWIAISIMIMEIFTIFLPCWEVYRHQNLKQETLDSIAQWESKNKFPPGTTSKSINSSVPTMVDSTVSGWKSTDGSVKTTGSNDSVLTMGALEHVLERNPAPLLEFSALRDFSGENIAFLTSVIEWKALVSPPRSPGSLAVPLPDPATVSEEDNRDRFSRALRIYTDYISSRDAEFQINLPSATLKKLEAVFEEAARSMRTSDVGEVDPATPFDMPKPASSASSDSDSEKGMMSSRTKSLRIPAPITRVQQYTGEIPEVFKYTVFDDAEASIKYLVLTNTWPKFLKERRSSMESV